EEPRQQLAAIIDSADDAILSKGLDEIIRSWNAGAERLFGYRAEEIIGRSATLLTSQNRLDEEPRIFERLMRGEQVEPFESVRRKKDGKLVPVYLRISSIKDINGSITSVPTIVRDSTEQKP